MSVIHSWFEQIALKKWAIWSKKTYFLYVSKGFPTFNAPHRIAPIALCSVTLYKRAAMSYLLFFTSKALFCSQKTSDLLKKPMSEFPTLVYTRFSSYTHCNVDTYKDSIRDLKFCRGSPLIEFLRNILLNLFLVCYCFIILDRKITDQQYVSVVTFPVLVSNRQLAIWFCVALFLIYARHNWEKVSLCYPWQANECQLYLIHVLIWLANHWFEQDDEAVQCATTTNHPSC